MVGRGAEGLLQNLSAHNKSLSLCPQLDPKLPPFLPPHPKAALSAHISTGDGEETGSGARSWVSQAVAFGQSVSFLF